MESNDSPEIHDRERTSDTPGLTLGVLTSEIRINQLSEIAREKKLVVVLFDAFFYKDGNSIVAIVSSCCSATWFVQEKGCSRMTKYTHDTYETNW